MLRLNLRSVRFRIFAAVVFVAIVVLGLGGGNRVYVAWQIRTAKTMMNMGSVSRVQVALRQLDLAAGDEPPDAPELLYLLGRASRRAGSFEKGLEYLQMAESAGWDKDLVQQQRRLAFFQRGRIDEGALDRLLQQNASDELAYEVYEALAKGYLFSYRFTDALHCLNFWSDWCPTATDPRMWRGGIWVQSQRWDKANQEYQAVLKIDPSHLDARLALAQILLHRLNQVESARREFQICLDQSPGNFDAELGLAACERRLADSEGAERRLRRLLNRDLTPEQLTSLQMELGQALLERRAHPEAVAILSEVVESDPLSSAAYYALGSAYAIGGDREKSKECFERSKALLEQFTRLTTITAELINHPEMADLRWEAGKILMDQKLFTEGAAWMATALIYEPNHQPTHKSLAEYYEKIKPDERLARQHREKTNASK